MANKARNQHQGYRNKKYPQPEKPLSNEETMDGKAGKQFYKSSKLADVKYGNNEGIRQDKNPPSDYIPSDPILSSVGSFSYNTAVGTPINLGIPVSRANVNINLPGVFVTLMAPTLGMCDDNTSSANVAARDIYQFVRHLNSGGTNYDPMDLMIYLGAIDSCYLFHQYLMRLYGVLQTYSAVNRYLPEMLVDAMCINFADVRSKITQLSGYINLFAVNLEAFYVPDVMPVMKVHSQAISGIMRDSDSERANMFMLVPAYFYQLNETSEGGGSLQAVPFITDERMNNPLMRYTLEQLMEYGNSLIQAVMDSQDCGTISGDLMKAYGTRRYYISQMPLDYKVFPIQDDRLLMKIHNATICPTLTDDDFNGESNWNIVQDINKLNLVFKPSFALTEELFMYSMNRRVLDMYWGNPTNEDNMEATRWMVFFDDSTPGDSGNPTPKIFGTELLCGMYIGTFTINSTANPQGVQWQPHRSGSMTTIDVSAGEVEPIQYMATIKRLCQVTKFDWAPILYVGKYDNGDGYLEEIFGDLDNYIVVDKEVIKQLHLAATIAEFGLGQ